MATDKTARKNRTPWKRESGAIRVRAAGAESWWKSAKVGDWKNSCNVWGISAGM